MQKPEKPEAKPGKRIVSKGEYAANVGKKAVLSSYGSAVFLLGVASSALTCTGAVWLFPLMMMQHPDLSDFAVYLLGVALFGGCSYGLLHYGRTAMKEGIETKTGVPLTRANTGDLPAPESLVRASEQPLQAQDTVLLRAAAQGQQTPAEQLVRPAGEPQ